MSVSPEEFFMYLTIGLIVAIPLSVRLYRFLTASRTNRLLDEQFGEGRSDVGDTRHTKKGS